MPGVTDTVSISFGPRVDGYTVAVRDTGATSLRQQVELAVTVC